MRMPGGATPPTSSLRVASSGAMQQPAGITSSAITADRRRGASGSSVSGSSAPTTRCVREQPRGAAACRRAARRCALPNDHIASSTPASCRGALGAAEGGDADLEHAEPDAGRERGQHERAHARRRQRAEQPVVLALVARVDVRASAAAR